MKPANIMLKPEGNIKIIDFGIAREYKEQSLADTTVLGTKGYAPPEQYSGQTDARSDIFALGMTMYHLLTGIDPRGGEKYVPVRMWNPELSEGIEIIIDKCVQPAAENRYQNCSDLLYDLEHPDLITKDYKRIQKRKLRAFVISGTLAVALAAAGITCRVTAKTINNNDYKNLVSVSESTSVDEKIDSYMKAIDIYPEKLDAYEKMLTAYEDDGIFGKKQNDQFLGIYNRNKAEFDTSSKEYAELNYQIGMMYFNYYTDEDGFYSFSNRVQKAISFFEVNAKNENISPDFKEKKISDCYYQICSFYKTYILNSATVEEASKENYEQLLDQINDTLTEVEDSGAYDKLTFYNGVFMLLYDQRTNMEQVNVDQDKILTLLNCVYEKASELTVQKEQSQQLQREILDNYDNYREAIQRTYTNAEERKQ